MKNFSLLLLSAFLVTVPASASEDPLKLWPDEPELARKIQVIPQHVGDESACLGYKGKPVPLRAAPQKDAEILGYIKAGDHFNDQYKPVNDWYFAETFGRGKNVSSPMGWYVPTIDWEKDCTDLAG